MKISRIVFWVFIVTLLLAAGFIVWLCTGSFTYQRSVQKEFVIDEPISVICQRAMTIKPKPDSEDPNMPKIDIQEAAKNYSIGQPIDVEINHKRLGKLNAKVSIRLEMEMDALTIRSLTIHGKVVSLDPPLIKKYGKTLANVENFTFEFKISSRSEDGKSGGFKRFFSNSSKTAFELTLDSRIRVYFRDLAFVRSQAEQMLEEEQMDIVQNVAKFLDENLRSPNDVEKPSQKPAEQKAPKSRIRNLKKETVPQEQPQEEPQESAEDDEEAVVLDDDVTAALDEEETDEQDDEEIDVSGLDEEI